MNKKLVGLGLAAVMAVSLAACGNRASKAVAQKHLHQRTHL